MLSAILRTLPKNYALAPFLLLVLYSFCPTSVYASHFRYGHLSWKARPDLGTHVAEFSLFNSFRRDGYSGSGPDGRPITGDIITEFIGATTLRFGDGAALGTLDYVVVAFDPVANWIFAKALADRNNVGLPIVHTYSGPGPWNADIDSCCRISDSVNAPDGSYRVLTTVNFSTENAAPVSTLPTIVNCQVGGLCTFSVPAADSDGDTLRYRLSNGSEDGSISQPAGLTINGNTGQVSWNTVGRALGLYSCQVTIEARSPSGGALKSQTAVDFLINLSNVVPGTAPVFDESGNFSCGNTFDHVAGRPLTFTVSAFDNDAGNTVTLNAIGLPSGAAMTPSLPRSGNPISSTFNWTPSSAQGGSYVIVFTATDNAGLQSQCSAIVDVKVDSDGDGLPDDWEINGYTFNGVFVDLPAMGANPDHKDIFVEIDYMTGHRPRQAAIDIVRDAFARVPNNLFAIPNPDGADGITLHVNIDDEFPHADQLGTNSSGNYNWTEFDNVKFSHFSEALSLSHHYCLFIHNGPIDPQGRPNSGVARGIPSSDFIVSLGSFSSGSFLGVPFGEGGTTNDQAGTFMHELGHNLGLQHGGFESFPNYKPNYLSVMNYTFQLGGLRINGSSAFDYSRLELPQLNESNLDENIGLNGGTGINNYGTSWFCGSSQQWTNNANGAINWNCNKKFIFFDDIESSVATDINKDGAQTIIRSFNDWAHINFKGGLIGAGVVFPLPTETLVEEIDLQTAQTIVPAPPSALSAQHISCAINLNWTALGPLNDYSYRVYRRSGSDPFVALTTTNSTTASDATINGAQTYAYYVTSINALGTESGQSEIVTVKGGIDRLTDLKAVVEGYNVDRNFETSLLSKMNAAQAALTRGANTAACNMLQSLIQEVSAQFGKKLTAAQTTQLTTEIANLRSIICCP